MKLKSFLLVLGLFLLAAVPHVIADPVVSNVQASQRAGSKLIYITYTLTASASCNVSLRISSDGGSTWTVPADTYEAGSHIGSGITAGNRSIVWNSGADWNDQWSDQMRVEVTATLEKLFNDAFFIDGIGHYPGGVLVSAILEAGYSYHLARSSSLSGAWEVIDTVSEAPEGWGVLSDNDPLTSSRVFYKIFKSEGMYWLDWVESQNMVGYANVPIPSYSSSLLINPFLPLWGDGQTVPEWFDGQLSAGDEVHLWDVGDKVFLSCTKGPHGWIGATNEPLGWGRPFWIVNNGVAKTVTLMGEVPTTPYFSVTITEGLNVIGSPYPWDISLGAFLEEDASPGDQIQMGQPTSTLASDLTEVFTRTAPPTSTWIDSGGSDKSSHVVLAGQGLYYMRNSGPDFSWTAINPLQTGYHSAVSPLFTVYARDQAKQAIRPGETNFVLSGRLNGVNLEAVIEAGADASFVYIQPDWSTWAPKAYVPGSITGPTLGAGLIFIDDVWLLEGSGAQSGIVLSHATELAPMYWESPFGYRAGDYEDFPFQNWPAARYTWEAYDASGNSLRGGTFVVGRLNEREPPASAAGEVPVVLLHGIVGNMGQMHDLAEELASHRPVYTVEYPNIGDIPVSAALLGHMLSAICGAHGSAQAHVVAHSMGGVVSRYYKQHLAASMGNHLHRLFTLGSPFEGSRYADAGTSEGFISATVLAALADLGNVISPAAALQSTALKQLVDPQSLLNLQANSAPTNSGDLAWLATSGTKVFLDFDESSIPDLFTGSKLNLLRVFVKSLHLILDGSDSVVSWNSSLKPPLEEPRNIYYRATHIGYFKPSRNEDYVQMIQDIRNFLSFGIYGVSSRLEERPQYRIDPFVTEALAHGQGLEKGVAYYRGEDGLIRIVGGVQETGKLLTYAVTRLLGAAGVQSGMGVHGMQMTMSAPETLFVSAPGFEPTPIGVVYEDGSMEITSEQVELIPDPTWDKPRNTSVRVNDGAHSTTSPSVTLTLYAENMSPGGEYAVYEPGEEPSWQSYPEGGPTLPYTFSAEPGTKTIYAAFRNSHGEGPLAVNQIELVQAGQVGSLAITDNMGGAFIVLNGSVLSETTPATISGLVPGTYIISLVKRGVEWKQPVQQVTVAAGETTAVHFDRVPVQPAIPRLPVQMTITEGGISISWTQYPERRYSLYRTTNLMQGFSLVDDDMRTITDSYEVWGIDHTGLDLEFWLIQEHDD
jgi:pimeloyl-ACP methyl ester carboxylesterase